MILQILTIIIYNKDFNISSVLDFNNAPFSRCYELQELPGRSKASLSSAHVDESH